MPANVTVHLHFPSHDKEVVVQKKIALDGTFIDERAQFKATLQPGMNHHGYRVQLSEETMKRLSEELKYAEPSGEIIHINAERGVQIKADNLKGWTGIDGRYTFAAQVRRDAQDLQAGREPPKSEKFVVWMGIAIIALIIGLVIVAAM
jgi:hypothetical protein